MRGLPGIAVDSGIRTPLVPNEETPLAGWDGSRDTRQAMSQENVEVVMAAYDAAQRQDGRSVPDLLDPTVVWDMSGLGMPDLAQIYRGHDGILEFWSSWLAAWR